MTPIAKAAHRAARAMETYYELADTAAHAKTDGQLAHVRRAMLDARGDAVSALAELSTALRAVLADKAIEHEAPELWRAANGGVCMLGQRVEMGVIGSREAYEASQELLELAMVIRGREEVAA